MAMASMSDLLVRKIWGKVLNKQITDDSINFFLEGGDSLSAGLLLQYLNEQLALELTPAELYANPNLQAMQRLVKARLQETA